MVMERGASYKPSTDLQGNQSAGISNSISLRAVQNVSFHRNPETGSLTDLQNKQPASN